MGKISRNIENINIFLDTQKYCKKDKYLRKIIELSDSKQEFISGDKELSEVKNNRLHRKAKIIVSKKRTLEAAQNYKGKKICILNFANAENPGGGVLFGANTQEEGICRCSTLYENISNDVMMKQFYKPHRKINALYNDDIIYTPDVVVFRADTSKAEILSEDDWYRVNVITCAAPDLGTKIPGKKVSIDMHELMWVHYTRIERIFNVAKEKGNQVVILGAFGCGDFCNPPEIVAEVFGGVLEKYRRCFETVEFAIYSSHKDNPNYEVFKHTFDNLIQ